MKHTCSTNFDTQVAKYKACEFYTTKKKKNMNV